MPLVVIPARKGTTGSWSPRKEWEKEDKLMPAELDHGIISSMLQALANLQMRIEGKSYGEAYYPFYVSAVRTEAFDAFEKELPEMSATKEWGWMRKTYDTNDVYLKFTRLAKADLEE